MLFRGISRTFSTVGNGQYETIGAFWDELAARFGRENLRGLGYGWTEDSICYAIGPKDGCGLENDPAFSFEIELPEDGWVVRRGMTDELSRMYDEIYRNGNLDYEIETFAEDGSCEVRYFRRPVVVREMTIADYENVYRLWLSCTGMGLNDKDDSEEGIAKYLRRNPGTCFVAECGGQIVGVILSGNDGRRGFIHHTAVHPRFRRRGIGSRLVENALTALRSCGINKVALVVFERNRDGNAFWEKMGFSQRDDLSYRNKSLVNLVRIDT